MEQILYYNPEKNDDTLLFTFMLAGMGVQVKKIEKRQLHQQVGYLAALKGFEAQPELDDALLPVIDDKFMVLCGFSDERLDVLLAFLKGADLPKVPLKAILTQTNSRWSAAALYREIKREHEYMAAKQKK